MQKKIRAIIAIAKVTFREIAKDRIFYSSLVIAVLLLLLSFIASRLSYLTQERVIRDFGLGTLRLANGATSILFAAGLLAKEIERRTAFVALARPITRHQFLIGKFFGLFLILIVNGALLSLTYFLLLLAVGAKISFPVLAGALLSITESVVIGAVSIFISSFSTMTLTALFSVGIWVIGNNLSELRVIASKIDGGMLNAILSVVLKVVPDFEVFQLGFKITYELPITARQVLGSMGYGVLWMSFLLLVSGMIFKKRQF